MAWFLVVAAVVIVALIADAIKAWARAMEAWALVLGDGIRLAELLAQRDPS
jgi:hypothetical protein